MHSSLDSGKTKKIVIVDDHAMIVELITDIVERLPGFKVVGRAASCREAREICMKEKPDFLILDIGLPDASGLVAYEKIKADFPNIQVLIFSGNLNETVIPTALVAGVDGILSKASATEELRQAISSVSSGQAFLCNQTSATVRDMVRSRPVQVPRVPPLSERERTVLRYLASGLSSKEIAGKLGLSRYTVNNYRAKLSKKTGLHRAVQLSRYAAQIGLLKESANSTSPFA